LPIIFAHSRSPLRGAMAANVTERDFYGLSPM
jgi:hypothetical protein